MNVIGIDVSKLTLSCFDGRDYFEIKNNRRSVASFVAGAAKNNARLIYEATGPFPWPWIWPQWRWACWF